MQDLFHTWSGTHRVSDPGLLRWKHKQMLSLREARSTVVEDLRVLYVKLADRVYNMRTIGAKSYYKRQRRNTEETLLFFVPLAKY